MGKYSSPSLDFGAQINNPAVLANFYKNASFNITHLMGQDSVKDDSQTIEGNVLIRSETDYKLSGEQFLLNLKFQNIGMQLLYSPKIKISKTIPLNTQKSFYNEHLKKMKAYLGYKVLNDINIGINYTSLLRTIFSGSTDGASNFYSDRLAKSIFGSGLTYSINNFLFLGMGINIVLTKGDNMVANMWQENYLSASYAQSFEKFITRMELTLLTTPEAKERSTSTQLQNHHPKTFKYIIDFELKVRNLIPLAKTTLFKIINSKQTDNGINNGKEKKSTELSYGITASFTNFNIGAILKNLSIVEGIRKSKFQTIAFDISIAI